MRTVSVFLKLLLHIELWEDLENQPGHMPGKLLCLLFIKFFFKKCSGNSKWLQRIRKERKWYAILLRRHLHHYCMPITPCQLIIQARDMKPNKRDNYHFGVGSAVPKSDESGVVSHLRGNKRPSFRTEKGTELTYAISQGNTTTPLCDP